MPPFAHTLLPVTLAFGLLGPAWGWAADTTAKPQGAPKSDAPPSATYAWQIPPGRVAKAVAGIDAIMRRSMDETGVPGLAIAVVYGDEVVYAQGFGVSDVRTGERVDADTVFQLASVSKPLGATMIARAVHQGAVAWDDPIVKHSPGFALSDPYVTQHVTIEDMYAHRSGLPDQAGDRLEDLGYDRADVLARLRLLPLEPFRAVYRYTNFGVTAAAEAVAAAGGTDWATLSQRFLYQPLGMARTSSRFADYEAAPNRAVTHVRDGERWVARYTRQPDAQSPAGGASSSVNDMSRWLRLLLADGRFEGKELISSKEVLDLRTPRMTSNPLASPEARASSYALGMGVSVDETGRVRLTHSGAFMLGAATTIALVPAEQLGVVVLTNGMPIGVPEAIAAEFLDLAETGTVSRDWLAAYQQIFAGFYDAGTALGESPPAQPAPPRPTEAYIGTYANAYYGPGEIVVDGEILVMVLGPDQTEFPLRHWDGDTFAYQTTGENASGRQGVRFTADTNGRVLSFAVEDFNRGAEGKGNFGVFTRP
jgi:CubicO group peptidase (beta-lactamase class C family)